RALRLSRMRLFRGCLLACGSLGIRLRRRPLALRGVSMRLRRRPRVGRRESLVAHELGSEGAFGLELVVGATPDANARHGGLAAAGERLDVIEFEPRARCAPVPRLAHERALGTIPLPDGALDLCRD